MGRKPKSVQIGNGFLEKKRHDEKPKPMRKTQKCANRQWLPEKNAQWAKSQKPKSVQIGSGFLQKNSPGAHPK